MNKYIALELWFNVENYGIMKKNYGTMKKTMVLWKKNLWYFGKKPKTMELWFIMENN